MPRRATHPVSLVAGLLVAGLVMAACNDDGRTLPPAEDVPDSIATLPPDDSLAPANVPLSLSSDVVEAGGLLPADFTCDGTDIVPQLTVAGVPPEAAELAITMVDLDANGYVHLVAAGLAPDLARIESGALPPDARFARTTGGVIGWQGPCPPAGDGPHRYQFSLWVLVEPLGLAPDLDGATAIDLITSSATASTTFEVRYER